MHFCEYELCCQPEGGSECGSIGLLPRTLTIFLFFVLLCFVLALGSQASGTYYRSRIREDFFSCSFQPLTFKEMVLFTPLWEHLLVEFDFPS